MIAATPTVSILIVMSDASDVPISQEGLQQPASPIQGFEAEGEDEERRADGTFRRLAPPVLSREQLRSPLATPGKSPSMSSNPSVVIQGAAHDSSNDAEEELLPRRRARRESAPPPAATAAKVAAVAPVLATAQELVDWCIAQAMSVTTLPFEQAPSSVAAQFAAFSAAFHEQVCFAMHCLTSTLHSIVARSLPCTAISTNSLPKSVESKVTGML
jgi:hypothetical protein